MYASLPAVSKVSVRSRTSIVLCADNSFSFHLSIQKKDGDSSKGRRLQRRPIKRRHFSDLCFSQTRFHSITCPASEGRDHFRRLSSGPAPLHRRSACSSWPSHRLDLGISSRIRHLNLTRATGTSVNPTADSKRHALLSAHV